MQAIRVRDLDADEYARFGGEVLAARSIEARAEVVAEWTALARDRYGAEVVARELAIPAKPRLLDFVEVHPNSPQLTVSFREPWILSIVPGWSGLESFDPSRVQSYIVEPGVGVLIPPGLWHGSVTPLDATDVLVVFRADVRDEWTELPHAIPLVIDRATV